MRLYAAIAAVLGWFALALQLNLIVVGAPPGSAAVLSAIAAYFGFFTILTNIFCAMVLTYTRWDTASKWGRFFANPGTATAAAVYIAVVGATYSIALRELWSPQGAQRLADHLLHDVMPIAYLVFWAIFVPKDSLRWKDAVKWLSFPGIYLIYMLVRGAATGVYPYPFVDVRKLGYPRILANAGFFLAIFLGTGLAAVAIGRLSSGKRKSDTQRDGASKEESRAEEI